MTRAIVILLAALVGAVAHRHCEGVMCFDGLCVLGYGLMCGLVGVVAGRDERALAEPQRLELPSATVRRELLVGVVRRVR